MDMGDHDLFFHVLDVFVSFFEEIIYLPFRQLEESDIRPSCAKNSHILVFHRISMDILYLIEFRQKISCCNRFMIARDDKDLFFALHERFDNSLCAFLSKRQIPAENHQVNMFPFCLLGQFFGKVSVAVDVSCSEYPQLAAANCIFLVAMHSQLDINDLYKLSHWSHDQSICLD